MNGEGGGRHTAQSGSGSKKSCWVKAPVKKIVNDRRTPRIFILIFLSDHGSVPLPMSAIEQTVERRAVQTSMNSDSSAVISTFAKRASYGCQSLFNTTCD